MMVASFECDADGPDTVHDEGFLLQTLHPKNGLRPRKRHKADGPVVHRELRAQKRELGARNRELAARNRELAARNRELWTQNRELGAQNRELGNQSLPWKNGTTSAEGGENGEPIAAAPARCPFERQVEPDNRYVAAILKILEKIGRPYFLGGGGALSLLRFGSLGAWQPGGDRHVGFDTDLDFFVLSEDDGGHDDLLATITEYCEAEGIFSSCDWSRISWAGTEDMALCSRKDWGCHPFADFFDLREVNATHLLVHAWGRPSREWLIERDTVMPFGAAKLQDLRVPVPHRPVKFFSEALPDGYANGTDLARPEYGVGCWGMAYSSRVLEDLLGGERELNRFGAYESVRDLERSLRQCAEGLDRAGFASFVECFHLDDGRALEGLSASLLAAQSWSSTRQRNEPSDHSPLEEMRRDLDEPRLLADEAGDGFVPLGLPMEEVGAAAYGAYNEDEEMEGAG